MATITPSKSHTSTIANPSQANKVVTGGIGGINFANFNQDFSCVSVGYGDGYRIFNCEPFNKCFEHLDGSIGIVEMLFCSSLLAIVGTGETPALSPRRLKIINTKRNTTICELTFPTSILSVKMNRESLIVVLEETIYIYDITNIRLLHTIETPSNLTGLISLSSAHDNNFLAYPSPQKISKIGDSKFNQSNVNAAMSQEDLHQLSHANGSDIVRNGDVVIFDCKTLHPISVIEAHKTQIAAMTFNHDGTLLATASDKGTIVRVFSVQTGVKLYQFRRGTYNTRIYSLAFSPDSMFVIASSATETVHIFRLGEEEAKNTIIKSKGTSGWLAHKKNLVDKNIEEARQKELDKIVKNRVAAKMNGDLEDGIDGIQINNFDSEDEDDEDLNSMSDSDLDDNEEEHEDNKNTHVEGDDILQPLPSDLGRTTPDHLGAMSIFSAASAGSAGSTGLSKSEPLVDKQRRSVARMFRRTSQSLGRKAAEKMGTYLPPKFSSILEPNRHFASLKVPTSKDTPTVVGIGEVMFEATENMDDEIESINSCASRSKQRIVPVMVVSADGIFYKYGLDADRGGDCLLLCECNLVE